MNNDTPPKTVKIEDIVAAVNHGVLPLVHGLGLNEDDYGTIGWYLTMALMDALWEHGVRTEGINLQ